MGALSSPTLEIGPATPARRILAALGLALVASQFAILDALFRGASRSWIAEPRALLDVGASVGLWLALGRLATARSARVLLALMGQNLLDEQVHVPAWIIAGEGTLSPAQTRALADHAGRFVTHLDLLPTVLDALGLWDNFAVAPHRARLPGRSLLRPHEERAPIPVTNCTGMFPCPVNTWGFYDGDRKLVARVYDSAWRCLALGGPEERLVDGPDLACARLRALSVQTFPLLPNGAANR